MSTASIDFLQAALRLQQQDRPHAIVTVLRVQPPASARPGDKALVTAEGIELGWIGGGCSQPAVLKTVRLALADGRARVVRIAPSSEGEVRELGDVLEFGMSCHSGGTIELFVDPMLARARLTVVGDSPLAVALSALGPRVGLPVTVVAHGAANSIQEGVISNLEMTVPRLYEDLTTMAVTVLLGLLFWMLLRRRGA